MSESTSYGIRVAALFTVVIMVISGFGALGMAEKTPSEAAAPGFEDLFAQLVEGGDFAVEDVRMLMSESGDGSQYDLLETPENFVVLRRARSSISRLPLNHD